MSDIPDEYLEHYKMISENLHKYGEPSGEPDKESGRGFDFDGKRVSSFFNKDKTSLFIRFSIQDHETAGFSMSIKAAYFLMRLIDERLCELGSLEGRE